MKREKNKVWVFIGILFVIQGIVNLIRSFMEISGAPFFLYLSFVLDGVALVFACIYLFKGYGKDKAKLYRYFLMAYGLACIIDAGALTIVSTYYPVFSFLLSIMQTYTFGVIMVLIFAKDLGEDKSILLSLSLLVLVVILLTGTCFYLSIDSFTSTYDEILDLAASRYFALSYTLFICVKSKYVDKADRGTK